MQGKCSGSLSRYLSEGYLTIVDVSSPRSKPGVSRIQLKKLYRLIYPVRSIRRVYFIKIRSVSSKQEILRYGNWHGCWPGEGSPYLLSFRTLICMLGYITSDFFFLNQFRYRPRVAQRVPRVRGSQISRQSAHEGGKVVSLSHRPIFTPGNAPGTHFCWGPR